MPKIVQDMNFDWDSQASQFPYKDAPGISLERRTDGQLGSTVVDCLLYRQESGLLAGILYHYNEDCPYQQPGSCNLWVRPDAQHQGIGTALTREAWHRWGIVYEEQTMTPGSVAWIDALVEQGILNPERTRFIDEGV